MEPILNPFLKPDEYYECEPAVTPRKKYVPSYMRPTKSSEMKKKKKSARVHQRESKERFEEEEESWSVSESSSVVRSLLKCYEEDFVDELDSGSTWLSSTCPEDSWFVDDSADRKNVIYKPFLTGISKGESLAHNASHKNIETEKPTLAAPLVTCCSPQDAKNGPWITLVPTSKRVVDIDVKKTKKRKAPSVKVPGYLRSTTSSSSKRRPKSPRHKKAKALCCA